MQTPVTFFLVLLFVLALFGAGAWLFRRFAGSRLGTNANRGRLPRLAVIDAAAVDGRRRLVLVRRDNIEHLLMIGGPTDIVVEPNIVRAQPAREQGATRAAVPAPEPNWQEAESIRNEPVRGESFDLGEPAALPEPPPPRAPRTAFPDEPRRQPPPPPRLPEQRPPPEPRSRPSDPFAGLTADLTARSEPPPPPPREPAPVRPAQRSEPLMPRPAARPAEPPPLKAPPPVRAAPERAPAPATADQNLAEMAQRLEAALRRPGETKTDTADRAPPVAPDATPSRPARTPAAEPAAVADSGPADAPRASFKNLEEEMASLLGRPKNST
jgi:flagellar protein FliO/FliZ